MSPRTVSPSSSYLPKKIIETQIRNQRDANASRSALLFVIWARIVRMVLEDVGRARKEAAVREHLQPYRVRLDRREIWEGFVGTEEGPGRNAHG